MRFLCDAMLGRLARDLRLLGWDTTLSSGDLTDAELAAAAQEAGRILITCDRALAAAAPEAVLLRTPTAADQLRELGRHCDLQAYPEGFLARCSVCNERLRHGAAGPVPPDVDVETSRHCPSCRRSYWNGTHVDAMRRRFGLDDDRSGREASSQG